MVQEKSFFGKSSKTTKVHFKSLLQMPAEDVSDKLFNLQLMWQRDWNSVLPWKDVY